MSAALRAALVTGVFCAAFTFAVELVTDALSGAVLLGLSFASGFLGSLVARAASPRGQGDSR